MRNTCKLVKGVVTSKTSTVGPKHDPYGRTTITMHNHNNPPQPMWELILCGLAGITFKWWGEDGEVRELHENEPNMESSLPEQVEKVTGMSIYFWETKLWQYQDRALFARVGPEQYGYIQDMLEADARLLSYAM